MNARDALEELDRIRREQLPVGSQDFIAANLALNALERCVKASEAVLIAIEAICKVHGGTELEYQAVGQLRTALKGEAGHD